MKIFLSSCLMVVLASCQKNTHQGSRAIKGQVQGNNMGKLASVFIYEKGATFGKVGFRQIKQLQTNASGNYIDSIVSNGRRIFMFAFPEDTNFDISASKEFNYGNEFIANIELLPVRNLTFELRKINSNDTITQVQITKRLTDQLLDERSQPDLTKDTTFVNRYKKSLPIMQGDSVLINAKYGEGNQIFEINFLKNGKLIKSVDTVLVNSQGTRIKEIKL